LRLPERIPTVLYGIIDIQAKMMDHHRHEPAMPGLALENREQASPRAPCGNHEPIERFVGQSTKALY
jgi:hypothetical protein